MTALHVAARGGFEEIVNVLLEAGARVDVQSPNATTALMEAARAGHLNCVRILVNAGANVHTVDVRLPSAMFICMPHILQ